jgi:hypothetical protein
MLTVRQLILLTHNHRRSIMDKAKSVAVRFVKITEDYDDDGDPVREVLAICHGETVDRRVVMRFYGKGANAHVWVSCDCEYFLYHCEVADQRKGNTDIEYSNGRWPKETNPRGIAHLCKHIVACISHGAADKRALPKKAPPKKVTKPGPKEAPETEKKTAPKTSTPSGPSGPGLQRLGRSGRMGGK